MSIPRDHHYIPKFYQDQWTGMDGHLCVYQRVPGKGDRPDKILGRRRVPKSTGFKRDLYAIEGVPPDQAQDVERGFMSMVDTDAARALLKIISGDRTPWSAEMRSAWTRFIFSLVYRNPEAVAVLRTQMADVWQAVIYKLRSNYDEWRQPDHPPTFAEYERLIDPTTPTKAPLILLQQIIDNENFGPTLFNMTWSRVPLVGSRIPLLTSDRPIDMPFGLSSPEAYIMLPVSPYVLFVASHDGKLAQTLAAQDPTEVAMIVNRIVVRQARQYVYGVDASQLALVETEMSKAPDRTILTEVQKHRAIDAISRLEPMADIMSNGR